MKIKDRREYDTKPSPLTCGPDMTVLEATQKMSKQNFGSIVVVDEDRKVLGLMTERDIFRRIVAEQKDPKKTKVSEVMSTQLRTAYEGDDLTDWLRIMSNERFRRLPIINEEGQLVSLMSQGDFVSYTWPELVQNAKTMAKATMSKNYQILLVFGGIFVYALISLFVLSRAGG